MRTLTIGLLACIPLLLVASSGGAAEPTLAEALKGANDLLAQKKLVEAEAAFHRAETLVEGPCGECILGLASVRAFQGEWQDAADLTQRALPLLTNDSSRARAYNQLSLAFASSTGKDGLAKAEEAARTAVGWGGVWGEAARRNLAQILFLEERWPEAVQVAREALAKAGKDKAAAESARIVLCSARYHLPEDEPEPDWSKRVEPPPEVTRPVKIAGPNPEYPAAVARLHQTQGAVVLDSLIDKEGCVHHVKVTTKLSDVLTEAALAAVRQWVFSPATLRGEPIPVLYTLQVNFKTAGPLSTPQ